MVAFLLSWFVLSAAVWVTAAVLPGFTVKNFSSAVGIAAIYGLLDWALGWLLFGAIVVGTLGLGWLLPFLTRWLVKALLLVMTDKLSSALKIRSFGTAVVGALVMTVVQTAGEAGVRWLL